MDESALYVPLLVLLLVGVAVVAVLLPSVAPGWCPPPPVLDATCLSMHVLLHHRCDYDVCDLYGLYDLYGLRWRVMSCMVIVK